MNKTRWQQNDWVFVYMQTTAIMFCAELSICSNLHIFEPVFFSRGKKEVGLLESFECFLIHIPFILPSILIFLKLDQKNSKKEDFASCGKWGSGVEQGRSFQDVPGRSHLLHWKPALCRKISSLGRQSSQAVLSGRILSSGSLLNSVTAVC